MPTPEEQKRYDMLDEAKQEQEIGASSPVAKFKGVWAEADQEGEAEWDDDDAA